MIRRIKNRRLTKQTKRLHKQGLKNMVFANDLCNHINFVLYHNG